MDDEINGDDLKSYYKGEGEDDFSVTNVLMRRDGNFMQGFYFDSEKGDHGQFVESAGLYGESKVQWLKKSEEDEHILEPDTETRLTLDDVYFGEGMCPRNANEFLVLTWQERTVFNLNRNNLEMNDLSFTLPSDIQEGWGITADETNVSENGNYQLYVSDGSDKIFVLDGDTFEIRDTITVTHENGTTQKDINELEFIEGFIYANVWYRDDLLRIDPATGTILKIWDISSLSEAEREFQTDQKGSSTQDCLNGIAYDKNKQKFYLSGKKHHLIFEVTLN